MKGILYDQKAISVELSQPLPDVTEQEKKRSQAEILMKPIDVSDIKIPSTIQDERFDQLIYREPYITHNGNTFEFERISEWLEKNNTDPADNQILDNKTLIPNKGYLSRVTQFLDKYPKVRDSAELYLPRRWVKELEIACEKGDMEAIKRLYDLDKRLFSWTFDFTEEKYIAYQGKNILHITCVRGQPEAIVKLFEYMEKRAEGLALLMLLQKDGQGKLPIHYAMKPSSDGRLMRVLALKMGKHLTVVESVSLPILEDQEQRQITPLHLAAMNNQPNIIQSLLENKENKIDITTKDHHGNTALHLAVSCGSVEAIRVLITFGASAEIENDAEQTPEAVGMASVQSEAIVILQKSVQQRTKTEKEQLQSSGSFGLVLLQQQQLIAQMQFFIKKQSSLINELQEQVDHLTDELTRQRTILHPVQRQMSLIEQERPAIATAHWQPMQFIDHNLPLTLWQLRHLVLEQLPARATKATLFFADAKAYVANNKVYRRLDSDGYYLTVFPDGTLVTAGSEKIQIWKGKNCTLTIKNVGNISALAPLSNTHLASGCMDGSIAIWDMTKGTRIANLTSNENIRAFAVLPNNLLASGTYKGTIDIWNTKTFTRLNTIQLGYEEHVGALAVLPNGHLISRSSSSSGTSIKMWDVQKKTCLDTLVNETSCDSYTSLAVLPNNRLASGSDNIIKIWDIVKKTCIAELKGHTNYPGYNVGYIQQLDVLPNGNLVSATKREIKIWKDQICLATLQEHDVRPFVIMPDSSSILSTTTHKQIKIWFIGKPLILDLSFQSKLLLANAQLYPDIDSMMLRVHTTVPCADALKALADTLQILGLENTLTIKISETELFISDIKDKSLFLDLENLCQVFGVSKLPSSAIQSSNKETTQIELKKHRITNLPVLPLTSSVGLIGSSPTSKKDYFNTPVIENDHESNFHG